MAEMNKHMFLSCRYIIWTGITWLLVSPVQAGELHEAVRQGIFSNIVATISASTNINEKDKRDGSTALHWAANKDRVDIVRYLISKGADVNAPDIHGDTPLCWTISNSRTNACVFLLNNKVLINTTNTSGQTPLHYACKDQAPVFVVKMLVVNGANLDASDKQGMRPIDYENREDVKSFMINNNAMKRGEIHEAVISHNVDKVRALIQRDPKVVDERSQGLTEQQFKQDKDLTNNIKYLSYEDINNERRYFIGWSPLHFAVAKGYIDLINILMSGGFIDPVDTDGNTPIIVAIVGRKIEIVKILINNGADIANNYNPLKEAVYRNAKDIVELLISKGADVNCRDSDNKTPLHWAAQCCYDEIVDLLISKGADVNARNGSKKQTPLHCAVSGSTPPWGDTNPLGEYLRKTFIIISLMKNGANINLQDTEGRTPLNYCISRSSYNKNKNNIYDRQLAEFLIQKGADVNIADNNRDTPLHNAVYEDLPVVELLIKYKANVNARNDLRRTPLHDASAKGNTNAIVLLINNGADINALDDGTYTPLDFARLPWVESIIQGHGGISAKKLRDEQAVARAKAMAEYEKERRHQEVLNAISDAESASRDAEDAARDAADASRDAEDAVREADDARCKAEKARREMEEAAYIELKRKLASPNGL